MSRNVEIKAKVPDRDEIVRLAKELSGKDPILLKQHDIFYNSPNGRLKMRTIEDNGVRRSELIWYDRPDVAGPKLSNYNKTDIPDEVLDGLKENLASSMGIKGEVKKHRYLVMYEQTRIHIDTVEGLGNFMELEVCLRAEQSLTDGEKIAEFIREKLNVKDEDLLTGAYMDMINAN